MRIDVQNISHRYDDLAVLNDISFTVEQGSVVTLIGPSGCGKSTLLSILGGLLRPSHGHVYLSGEAPDGCLNPLTYVFQDFALLPWRTVAGNLSFALEGHKLSKAEKSARIDEALSLTNLSEFRDAYPKQLSGGMRQRVGIARALSVKPAVMLMDEPLSALDAQTRTILLDEFSELFARTGMTAVYVTHNLTEAVRLANHVVALSRRPGEIKEVVTIDTPLAERNSKPQTLLAVEEHLWSLIRDEALVADRELDHA